MANLIQVGDPIVFADHAGDFSPSTNNNLSYGTPVNVQMIVASLADAAARQSAKFDLGATFAQVYLLMVANELGATGLSAGEEIVYYISPSVSGTAAVGNAGGASGTDSAYTGYGTLADALPQLVRIGAHTVTGDATPTVQIATVGLYWPKTRYGSLIAYNQAATFHTDDVESHAVLLPIEIP